MIRLLKRTLLKRNILTPKTALKFINTQNQDKTNANKEESVNEDNKQDVKEMYDEVIQEDVNSKGQTSDKNQETYSKNELNELEEKDEVLISQIKPDYKSKLSMAKKICTYFNLPISVAATIFSYFYFGDVSALSPTSRKLYALCLMVDYLFFFQSFAVLFGARNLVLMCKYLPKEQAFHFTKHSAFCKEYVVKQPLDTLTRVGKTKMTPFLSVKNKRTNEFFSMHGISDWKDKKLFNTFFPPVKASEKASVKKSELKKGKKQLKFFN